MKLKDLLDRRTAVETEMRSLYDEAETASADLAGEKLERWNRLKAERDELKGKEDRARERDDLDRRAEGQDIETRGDEDGETVWALKAEQRMADYHQAATGESTKGLSVGRVICARLKGTWDGAEAEQRVMATAPDTVGGYMIPEPISANVLDLIRNQTVMIRAGALTIPMAAPSLRVIKVLSDPTASWRAEGQTIAESDGSFGALLLNSYSLAALVRINAELMDDAPMFASTLDNMVAQALGLKLDAAALYGTGAGQPLGLRQTAGLQEVSMGANGLAQSDYDDVIDLLQKLEEANAAPTTLVHSPRTKNKLAKLVTGISGDLTKLTPPADYAALRKLVSNQISIAEQQGSSNVASTTFIGGFEHTAFAMRQNLTIEASRTSGTAFEKNQVMVRAIMRADYATLRPDQLGRLIGIL